MVSSRPMRNGQEVHHTTASPIREWAIANGAGGSGHGDVDVVPRRRAHAWLHAALPDGAVTTVLLGLDERVRSGPGWFDLAAWPGREPGAALATLERFEAAPWPTWRLRCGELVVERALFPIRGHQAVVASYRHLEGPETRLRMSPLVVARDPDSAQREHPDFGGLAQGIPGRVKIETRPDGPTLTLWHPGTFLPNRMWRRGIEHELEQPRSAEDALVPGHLELALAAGQSVHVVASTEEALFRALAAEGRLGTPPPSTLGACVAALIQGERGRRTAVRTTVLRGADFTARQAAAAHGDGTVARRTSALVDENDPWALRLARAADLGLAQRAGRLTVIDPLPDGVERGTAALRALPGLVSVRAFATVREVARGFAARLDDGLVSNGLGADGGALPEDPETSLWLIHVVELLARRSEEVDPARELYPALESVFQYFRAGTRGGVRVGADGLLQTGEPATCGAGLNALWYHALVAMAQLARLVGRKENAAFYLGWARQHGQCFQERFWDDAAGGLHHGLSDDGPIEGLAPDHLLAVSLTPALLPPERGLRLVERIERELFTPLGLRPLPGAHSVETAWLGAFYGAYLRVHHRSPESQAAVRGWLDTLGATLDRVAEGHVPARFEWPARRAARKGAEAAPDAEPRPRGISPLAAAELSRVWIEEIAHTPEPASVP